jgi:tetraacyldisaccharide 4'-kinase
MGFVEMCAQSGIRSSKVEIFPDHHRYSASDIERLVDTARQIDADGFVTTEKDAVKLTPAMMDRLRSVGPVAVAALEVELLDEASALNVILTRLVT